MSKDISKDQFQVNTILNVYLCRDSKQIIILISPVKNVNYFSITSAEVRINMQFEEEKNGNFLSWTNR